MPPASVNAANSLSSSLTARRFAPARRALVKGTLPFVLSSEKSCSRTACRMVPSSRRSIAYMRSGSSHGLSLRPKRKKWRYGHDPSASTSLADTSRPFRRRDARASAQSVTSTSPSHLVSSLFHEARSASTPRATLGASFSRCRAVPLSPFETTARSRSSRSTARSAFFGYGRPSDVSPVAANRASSTS